MDKSVLEHLASDEILGLTLIGEARGEPIQGIVAVGCVIRNRLHNHPTKYKTYYDVCLEPKQFSCWNDNDPNCAMLVELADHILHGFEITDIYHRQCFWAAKGIIDWSLRDNTQVSQYYLEKNLFDKGTVTWAKRAKNPIDIGSQVFFNV